MKTKREDGLPPPPPGMMYVPEKPSPRNGGEGPSGQTLQEIYSEYRSRWFEAINGREVRADGEISKGRPK